MIQCVGCRQEDRNYCARVCCSRAIKNALKLKAMNPEMDIYVLFRDMRTYGFNEDYYREAADKDVKFIRYEPEDKPQVEAVEEGGRSVLRVTVTDPVLGKRLAIDADAVALAAAVIPSAGSEETARLFKVPLEPGRLLPGSARQTAAGRFRRGRRLPVRHGAVSQAHVRSDQPGVWRGRPRPDAAVARHRRRLRLRVRGERERVRVLRGLHHGLHATAPSSSAIRRAARKPRSIRCCARATACATRSARPGRCS